MQWLGLPHRFGAWPQDGEGADCVLMVSSVLEEAGVPHPPFDASWLHLAERGEWGELQRQWDALTVPLPAPQPYAVTLFHNGPSGLGVGVVVDDGLLMVHHRRGVCWVPLSAIRSLPYCTFRQP